MWQRKNGYDAVWWVAIALGLFAAMANLPVRESPIRRVAQPVPGASPEIACDLVEGETT